MNSVERVKAICKERKIPIYKLESDLDFSNGYIGQLRKGVFPADRLLKIANYLGVTTDYLMTGDDAKKAPTQDGEREIDDRKMKVSFFGGLADGLSDEKIDEYYDDARSYIGYKIMRDKEQGNKPD